MNTQQADLSQRNAELENELALKNRELEIEAALEKVRSRALAMHHSSELKEVVTVVFETLQALDFALQRAAAIICIFTEGSKDHIQWIADPGHAYAAFFNIPYSEHSLPSDIAAAKESGVDFFSKLYPFEEMNPYFNYLFEYTDYGALPDEVKQLLLQSNDYGVSIAFEENSAILIPTNTATLLSENQKAILKRFAKVFEQSYTRFLDLQKAEAQARESQIQLAVERVRARTMAMEKSDELADVATLLFKQVRGLDINTWTTGFNVWSDDNNFYTDYITSPQGGFMEPYVIDATVMPVSIELRNAKIRGEVFFINYEEGEALAEVYRQLEKFGEKQFKGILESGFQFPSHQYEHFVFGSKVSLMFITYEPVPEAHDIFKRFGKVFEQTYARFLDLQKAEAQTRESQIELSLERVRARTMAMQKSDELREVVAVIYEQLQQLGFKEGACNITIMNENSGGVDWWMSGFGNSKYPESYHVAYFDHPTHLAQLSAWKSGEKYTAVEVAGTSKKEFDNVMLNQTDFKKLPEETKAMIASLDKVIFSMALMKYGALVWATNAITDEHASVLQRFAKVFEQTYTRFLDLEQVEAQAKEAQIQLALERIRSRSLAMHHSNELKEVVAILFQQLKILGLEFDGGAAIHLFAENSKDAVIIVAGLNLASPIQNALPYDEEAFVNNPIILDVWHAKETGENIFNRLYSFEEKNKYFQYVFKHNGFEILPQPVRDFILQADSYTASFIAEKNSLLGASSWTRQVFSENDFDILKRIAKVFEQAYIRFLDLQKAEALAIRAEQDLVEIKAARKKAEDTLIELKATQAQLIQSEKMASLGELTAGIAHEIQNPLNFVNNFSEVNTELLTELEAEATQGNLEEIKSIAADLKENEQKITFHGKRADAIVKGMLQHSRTNTGKKEPTDINILADEYLRLSYHGLRAKDKTFNADFKTDFDETVGKINIVPQDMGRVLLNLYNNAFYAVHEQLKKLGGDYKPMVTVSTKKLPDKIEIKVADNGNGIPQNALDKIFQPFFTTKPTGQGTGLGLSLSYDIIKAHGGDIKVNTKEGKGAEFIIQLLLNNYN